MQSTRDPKFGPESPEMLAFYAGVVAAAGPGAQLDYANFLTIPEVVWGSEKRLALTYPMREFAQRFGQTPADAFNSIATPDVRLAMQRDLISQWENIAAAAKTDVSWLRAAIDAVKALWIAGAQKTASPAAPPVVVEQAQPPKPEGWDSTYVIRHTPFGDQWQKP